MLHVTYKKTNIQKRRKYEWKEYKVCDICQVLANHRRLKFLGFILDMDWSISVPEQWECAFEWITSFNFRNIFYNCVFYILFYIFFNLFHLQKYILLTIVSARVGDRSPISLPVYGTAPESNFIVKLETYRVFFILSQLKQHERPKNIIPFLGGGGIFTNVAPSTTLTTNPLRLDHLMHG